MTKFEQAVAEALEIALGPVIEAGIREEVVGETLSSEFLAKGLAPRVAAAIEAGKDALYIHTRGVGCGGCADGGHWHEVALVALRREGP